MLTIHSNLDEAAAKQRQREAEAEAKIQARKTIGFASRLSERPNPLSNDPAPPKIAGAGGGWRDRQAAKEAGQSAAPPPTAASAASPALQVESETPSATTGGKFVPPHLRAKGADGAPPRGESPADGGRGTPRERDENNGSTLSALQRTTDSQDVSNRDRTQSPANGAAPRTFERSFSGKGDVPDRTESPAAPQKPKVRGGYVPPQLRSK